jgi:Flp pilus assembly protein TadG
MEKTSQCHECEELNMRIAESLGTARPCRRSGVAAVELALLLPLLILLVLGGTDFCRLFYYYITITNCARNGALWASDPLAPTQSPYATVDQAAKADASNDIQNLMAVSSMADSDPSGSNIAVTVTYPFTMLINYPGIPSTVNIVSQVRMRVLPISPGS